MFMYAFYAVFIATGILFAKVAYDISKERMEKENEYFNNKY